MASFHRFGGFYRDIELEATPSTRVDDVWVRSDIDRQTALVNVSVRSAGPGGRDALALKIGIMTVDGVPAGTLTKNITLDGNGNADVVCEVPLTEFRLWTPETPNLYLADVTLVSGEAPLHGWTERFGIKKLEVRGEQFYLNGNPYLLRGFGDDYVYPMTLISPPDTEEHRKHLALAHTAGFNYVRHHTHCEIPEFFEAADETGILIQPELPYYHDITTEGFELIRCAISRSYTGTTGGTFRSPRTRRGTKDTWAARWTMRSTSGPRTRIPTASFSTRMAAATRGRIPITIRPTVTVWRLPLCRGRRAPLMDWACRSSRTST